MLKGFTHESQASITVEWYTPRWIFEALGLHFDLDPCAPEGGVPWIPTKKHYSLKDDGLVSPWDGLVWLNPPYGKHTKEWLAKMHEHRNGVSLIFSRTDCKWFHDYCAKADAILFLKGRVQFVDGTESTGSSGSSNGSILVGWGDTATGALKKMSSYGLFVQLSALGA